MDRNDCFRQLLPQSFVALRKESVDRNSGIPYSAAIRRASLSVRRAWIEITDDVSAGGKIKVALRKESVDRNLILMTSSAVLCRRSP